MSYIQAFEPLPWQVAPWRDTSPILLLTGSAGGGKSVLGLEKAHGFCLRYPGSTALVLRKIRESMANSTLLFLEREVIGNDPRVTHRKKDFRFEYDNGSVLAYGGMKDEGQRERIRSIGQKGGVDICMMEEATQFDEEDLNEVLARMRGTAAPWTQVILTTNPDAPGHWINIRLILGGEASVYKSRASDNFHNPKAYQETLSKLSGVQYRRLVKGEWAAGSGAILDTWEDEYNKQTGDDFGGNVTEDADYIPEYGSVVWSIDDGYSGKMDKKTGVFTGKSHPRAILAAQMRPDGILAIFAESLKIQTLATDHIGAFIEEHHKNGWPLPDAAVRDRAAASLDGALAKFHIKPRYNAVDVEESIKLLREYIAPDDNKVRRIIVHPRCFHLRYEALTFSYDNDGRIIKEYDHACFVAGTKIKTEQGDVPIEKVEVGDMVLTRKGYRKVVTAGMTDQNAKVITVLLSNGERLTGTANHPIFVEGRGFVPLGELTESDILQEVTEYIQDKEVVCRKELNTTGSDIIGTPMRLIALAGTTLHRGYLIGKRATRRFAERFTKITSAQFQTGIMFITLMAMRSTTIHQTLWRALQGNMLHTTTVAGISRERKHLMQRGSGIEVQRGENGTQSTARSLGKIENLLTRFVNNAAQNSKHTSPATLGFVAITAKQSRAGKVAWMTKRERVKDAALSFLRIDTPKSDAVPVRVLRVLDGTKEEKVYNLTVDGEHEYFASGVLVHNCDAARYLLFDKLYGKSHTVDIATYSDVVKNYGRQQYPTTD